MLQRLWMYIRLYLLRQVLNLQAGLEYKLDFVIGNAATITGQVTGIAFIWVIFQRVGDLNGWTLPEIMLIYGMAALPYGLFELLFNGLWGLTYHIRFGSLDEYMVRPGGPLFWIMSDATAMHGFGNAFTGIVIISLASHRLGFFWTIGRIAFLSSATICGIVIYTAVNLITASLSFWLVGTRTSIMFMVQRFRDFACYPLTIYSRPLRALLLWVVPFGFAGFVPAAALLKPESYLNLAFVLFPASVCIFVIAYAVWRMGVSHYTSTGS